MSLKQSLFQHALRRVRIFFPLQLHIIRDRCPKFIIAIGIPTHYPLAVWWKGDDDLEFFTLRCRREDQMRQWEATINRLIKEAAQRRASERPSTGMSRIITANSTNPSPQVRLQAISHYSSSSSAPVSTYSQSSHGSQPSTIRSRQVILARAIATTTIRKTRLRTAARALTVPGRRDTHRTMGSIWNRTRTTSKITPQHRHTPCLGEERLWVRVEHPIRLVCRQSANRVRVTRDREPRRRVRMDRLWHNGDRMVCLRYPPPRSSRQTAPSAPSRRACTRT
jgi:hypothetical protein